MIFELSGTRGKGKFVTIDDEDFDLVKKHKWWANNQGGGLWRPETDLFLDEQKEWGKKRVSLARYVLKSKTKLVIDHINGNPMDNRKTNLRACSIKNNIRNRKILNKNNSSKIRGVSWDKFRNKWVAQLMHNRKHVYLGRYDTIEEAKIASEKGLKKYFGKYA